MAIGFPANHQTEFMIPPTLHPGVIFQALQSMGWAPNGTPDGMRFTASSGMSFGSWGETITVVRIAADRIQVRSQCSFPTQVFDWGRNEQNVTRFLHNLVQIAQGAQPTRW